MANMSHPDLSNPETTVHHLLHLGVLQHQERLRTAKLDSFPGPQELAGVSRMLITDLDVLLEVLAAIACHSSDRTATLRMSFASDVMNALRSKGYEITSGEAPLTFTIRW